MLMPSPDGREKRFLILFFQQDQKTFGMTAGNSSKKN